MNQSYKFTVDNNFFDQYALQSDENRRKFRDAVLQCRLIFIPTTELIGELLGLYSTKRRYFLSSYASMMLFMLNKRIFNQWNQIVKLELGLLKDEGVLVPSEKVEVIRSIFEGLARWKGLKDSEELLTAVKKHKKAGDESFKSNKDFHLAQLKKLQIKVPKIAFNDFYNADYCLKIRQDTISEIYKRSRRSILPQEVENILNNQKKCPYFSLQLKVSLAMFYRFNVAMRGVRKGDFYDQNQLFYLAGLDFIVSEDAGMAEIAQDVFGESNKVLKFEELVKLL